MSIRAATELMFSRGNPAWKALSKLVKPIHPLGIDVIAYNVFQDINPQFRVRNLTLTSGKDMSEFYAERMQKLKFPDSAFTESQNYPLDRNSLFYPLDRRYLDDRPVQFQQTAKAYGLNNMICLSLRDDTQKITELFWFFSTMEESPEWIMEQVQNLDSLKKFVLYFRENLSKSLDIKKLSLSHHEIKEFYKSVHFEKKDICSKQNEQIEKNLLLKINRYYFGYPFNKALTSREFEVLKFHFLGQTSKEIGRKFNISYRTVEKFLEKILTKTCCNNMRELRQNLFLCPLFCAMIGDNLL